MINTDEKNNVGYGNHLGGAGIDRGKKKINWEPEKDEFKLPKLSLDGLDFGKEFGLTLDLLLLKTGRVKEILEKENALYPLVGYIAGNLAYSVGHYYDIKLGSGNLPVELRGLMNVSESFILTNSIKGLVVSMLSSVLTVYVAKRTLGFKGGVYDLLKVGGYLMPVLVLSLISSIGALVMLVTGVLSLIVFWKTLTEHYKMVVSEALKFILCGVGVGLVLGLVSGLLGL